MSTLIHSCWFKIQQPALAQYWIGRVAQYSIGANSVDDKSIAKTLSISEKTVRNHLTDVYRKLGVHKRVQLMALLR